MSLRGRFAACFFSAAAAAMLTVAVIAGADATSAPDINGPAAPAEVKTPACPSHEAVTGMPSEVRLRKLHLVRPDLIPYPIAYEVYC